MNLLLILQRDLPIASAPYLDAWQKQLESEGYRVTRAYGPKANTKDVFQASNFAKSTVWPWVRANPGGYLFFVGDLPMPRTGLGINPDGHAGSAGAYSSTLFYGCPYEEKWTDEGDNLGYLPRPVLANVPYDGKFDQQQGPGSEGMYSIGPLQAKVGWFNPYFNPKTFLSKLDSLDYVTDCIKRYFDLNVRWRRGEIKASLAAVGADKAPHNAGIVQRMSDSFGSDNVILFTRSTSATVPAPRLFEDDIKGFSESNAFWCDKATGAFNCALGLTFGSFQIDYRTLRTSNPMNCGYLAVGNMGRNWRMEGWQTKTLGELWEQTVNVPQNATHIILYGDPTLKLRP